MSAEARLEKRPDVANAQSRLVRDASGYMAATYASQIMAFGIGIVTKGLLGPEDLGLWTQLLALMAFLGLLEFGVIQATNKEIAYSLGKGDAAAADRYKRAQFSFIALTSALGALCVVGYALWSQPNNDRMTQGLLWVALMLPISQMQLAQVTIYWGHRRFGPTSLIVVLETVLVGTLGLLFVWQFGLIGQILSYLLILIVKLGVLAVQAKGMPELQIGFGWRREDLQRLLRSGIPLFLISVSNVAKLSGTVFLISHYFDTVSVGYYSLALSVQNFIYWTPNAFSVVMFPRFQTRYADSNDQSAALRSYLIKPIVGLAFFLLPLLLSATCLIVPSLIEHALPDYLPTIGVLAAMLPGTFFMSLEHMPGQFLTTTNRLWQRVTISLLSLAVMAVCVTPAVLMGGTIVHFVACLSVANFICLAMILLYATRHSKGPRSDHWLILKLVAAFAYLAAVVIVIDLWIPDRHIAWHIDLLLACGKWFLALVLLLPLFVLAERQLGLRSIAINFLRQRSASLS